MTNQKYILKNKKIIPVDLMTWAKWFESGKDRVIKQEKLKNGKYVSTVFLGLDHNYGAGEPLLFETMVFPANELDVERYSSYEEALNGHKKMVKKWS